MEEYGACQKAFIAYIEDLNQDVALNQKGTFPKAI
jgi:hypothetical protein